MLVFLSLALIGLSAADHWTTYVCLSVDVPGWEVTEANPIADWLFVEAGLVPGLLIDSTVTLAALAFLAVTTRVDHGVKLGFLLAACGWTGLAVANNLEAIRQMGLPLVGGG